MKTLLTLGCLATGLALLLPVSAAPPAKKAARPRPKRTAPSGKKPAPAPKPPDKPAPPMAFAPSELDLAPGETYPVSLFVPSPTGKAVESTLTYLPERGMSVLPDSRWTGKVPPWGVKTFPKVVAAPDASGEIPVVAKLEKGGLATLLVRIVQPGVEVVPGHQKLTVKLTNPYRERVLTGRVLASNPDRFLQDVRGREFRVEPGKTGEVVFPLPGAAPAEGETYEFTLTVETYQGYKDRKSYHLSFPAQEGT
ncbi:MAG TPA: hypothetical protein VFU47_12625 [Armatimonadota bacterium]|nr:hypothetical protein [Armatimonadota bacterium]